MSSIKSAPWRVLAFCAASDTAFHIPVAIAYYGMKGANLGDYLLLEGLFRATCFLLEIPTGYLADKWRRDHQLMVSRLLWVGFPVLLLHASTFTGLLVAEVVAAMAIALRSGTMDAYLHEALKASGITSKAQTNTWQRASFTVTMLAAGVGSLFGGMLFNWNVDAPAICTIVTAGLAFAVSLTLPHVPMLRSSRHPNAWKGLWMVAHHSLRLSPRLSALLWGPFTLFGFTGVLFWLMQARLMQLGVSTANIGIAFSCYFLCSATMSLLAGKLVDNVAERTLIALLPLCLTVGSLLMLTNSPWLVWLGGVVGAGQVFTLGKSFIVNLINHEVVDGERATVLSLASTITTVLSSVLLMGANSMLAYTSITTMLLSYLALTLVLVARPFGRLVFPTTVLA